METRRLLLQVAPGCSEALFSPRTGGVGALPGSDTLCLLSVRTSLHCGDRSSSISVIDAGETE